jgi:predicted NBD/HSP70 family sugar kinase
MSLERPHARSSRVDQTAVRRANLGVVLRHVTEHGPCSRARVAAATGLTRGTVSSLVAELIVLELLRESEAVPDGPRGVGRPGLDLEPADVVVGLGLEVNVDYLAVTVEDLRGTVHHERRVFVDNRGAAPGPVLDRIAGLATEATAALRENGRRCAGAAIAVPGLVERESGSLVFAPNLGWSDIPVRDGLRERLQLPVGVENEANLAALAEHWSGSARGLSDVVCVFGEVGIGGGILTSGELFRGSGGFGGEVGHVTVDPGGEPCACGNRGCLETKAGVEAIAEAAGIPTAEARTRSLAHEILRRCRAGDPAAVAAVGEAGGWLGIGLAAVCNVLDPEAVVLGGCFGPLLPWLADDMTAALHRRSVSARTSRVQVLPSLLGEGAAVRGAAALPLRRLLESPQLAARGEVGLEAAIG